MAQNPDHIPPLNPALLLDQIPDATFLLDTDWQVVLTNGAGERMLRLPKAGIEGHSFWECFPALAIPGYLEPLKQVMQTGRPDAIPEYCTPGGTRYALRTQSVVDGMLVFFLREAESEREEVRFRALVENALDGVSLLDADLVPFYRSPANERIFGVSNGRARLIPYHPDDMNRVRNSVLALASGESVTLEFRAVHDDRDWRWYQGTYTNRLDDPAVRGIVLNFRDITDRRRLADQMKQRTKELEESNRAQQIRLDRLETLHRVQLASTDQNDPVSSIRAILESTIARNEAAAYVFVQDTEEVVSVAHENLHAAARQLPLDAVRSISKRSIAAGEILTFHGETATDESCLAIKHAGFKGGQVAPFSREQTSGAVMILSGNHMLADEESNSYLSMLAGHVANAVSTGRLLEQLERSAHDYHALATFGHRIETVNDIDELVTTGLNELITHLHMHFAALAEIVGDFAVLRWIDGNLTPERERLLLRPIPLSNGAIAQAHRTGDVVLVNDYQSFEDKPAHLKDIDFTSVMALPIDAGKSGHYVFVIASNDEQHRISGVDASIAQLFANRIGNAFERVVHLDEVKATREATFRALGVALEYRDYETKGHTDRVMEITMLFAEHLGIGGEQLQALQWGAYLHDLGKLSVPDEVLLKPSRLSFAEFELIKRHPVTGEELCRNIPFLPDEAVQVVRSHHERWDGTGYPDGLVGEEIPLEARLFAIVDVFDALTSDRPYRPAWTREKTLAYLEEQAGSQFDPELVSRFIGLMNETPSN